MGAAKAYLYGELLLAEDLEDLTALEHKVKKAELRARDAEARLRIIEAEIAISEQRQKLTQLKEND